MNIKEEIEKIKKRNINVEADKAWEISLTRKLIITIGTYFSILIFLIMIESPNAWLTAIIPAAAYLISTLTLPYVKKWWIKDIYKRKNQK